MMIPLIVLGALALMLKSLPIEPYQKILPTLFGGRLVMVLDFIYGGTFQIFSVALAVTTSISYGMIRGKGKYSKRAIVNDCFILAVLTLISLMGYVGIHLDTFSVSNLGTTNTFMALFIALGTGWLYFKVRDSRILRIIRHPETDVDGLYYIAVQSILPAAVVTSIFAIGAQLFTYLFHVGSLQEGLVLLMEWVLSGFKDSFFAGLAILMFTHIMWFFGIHGSNVLDVVIQEHFAVVDGVTIYSKTFQDVFTIMGGCGAVLGLVLAILLFSRKRTIKNVARLALPGVIFNISEVIVFGLPIIFSPIFFLPFVLSPLLNYIVSYAATYVGLVPVVAHRVEWTTPIFLSGYQATGSLAGSLLQLFCLVMDACLYLPFIRMFETYSDRSMGEKVDQLVAILQKEEEGLPNTASLTLREDMLGAVARSLANDLRGAIERKELYMLYQTQVNGEGKCLGAEALLRWKHPIVGMIYPPLIIRLAKENGLLSELEQFIFDTAAHTLSVVEKIPSDYPRKISVNITNESLLYGHFEEMVDDVVARYGVSRSLLWMEITEQEALLSSEEVLSKFEKLKDKGHKFLIDDFGMGHTSLMYLQTNSFSTVKLDGGIIRDIHDNERHQDIIRSIVYLGQLLHFTTVAEFVETSEQVEMLKKLGVDVFQGYYYSRPIPLPELVEWMKEH